MRGVEVLTSLSRLANRVLTGRRIEQCEAEHRAGSHRIVASMV